MNGLTILLSFIAVLLAISYPFMKRYTYWPQAYLGATFGWAIPMAFAAQTGAVPALAWLLLLANIAWTMAYDTLYAMVDREDDQRIGVKSTAIAFGSMDKLAVGSLHIITLGLLGWVGYLIQAGSLYYLSLLAAAGFAIYQQWLVKARQPERCFQAFLNNNWFGFVIFIGIVWNYDAI
jgi:4-hydroxybenzoate polyprenyltransferase